MAGTMSHLKNKSAPRHSLERVVRIHYYSKVVEILNTAKQWERARIIKALCLLYGMGPRSVPSQSRIR